MPGARYWLAATLIVALAAGMRLVAVGPGGALAGLASYGLWYDETFSCLMALKPWPEMIWAAQQDVHPPLFYALLKLWFAVAPSSCYPAADAGWRAYAACGWPQWARLLPALLGVACVPAVIAMGGAIFSRRVGLLAGLFMAVSPYHVYYSHEVRMYGLGCLTVTLQMIFLWRVARRFNWRDGVLFAGFAALSLYTHYYLATILVGHFAFFVVMRGRAGDSFLTWTRRTLTLALLTLLFFLPWFPTFLVHYCNNTGLGVHAFSQKATVYDVVKYLFEWTLGYYPWFPFENPARPIYQPYKAVTVGLILYGLAVTGFVALWRRGPTAEAREAGERRRAAAWFATGAFAAPVCFTALYIMGPGRFFTGRDP